MDFQDALDLVNATLIAAMQRQLTEAETAILSGAWYNQTYEQIAEIAGYSLNYLQRNAAPKFWKMLSQILNRQLNKTNARTILIQLCQEVGAISATTILPSSSPPESLQVDWGEAPDVSVFYGRSPELTTLIQWIVQDRCRLIAVLGTGMATIRVKMYHDSPKILIYQCF